jgi:hypothetical protein
LKRILNPAFRRVQPFYGLQFSVAQRQPCVIKDAPARQQKRVIRPSTAVAVGGTRSILPQQQELPCRTYHCVDGGVRGLFFALLNGRLKHKAAGANVRGKTWRS